MVTQQPDLGIDVSTTTTVVQSTARALKFLVGGSAFTALCLTLVMHWIPDIRLSIFQTAVLWLGVAFFGGGTTALLFRLLFVRWPLYVLSPSGFAAGKQTIPWDKIRALTPLTVRNQKFVGFELDPDFEATLPVLSLGTLNKRMGYHASP